MRAVTSLLLSASAVLAIVPGWTGDERLALPAEAHPRVTARAVSLDERDPARRRVGDLLFLGGVALSSDSETFGGYSALAVRGDRFALLADTGVLLRFRLAGGRVLDAEERALPAGPGTGWRKGDRDAEALALDPAGRRAWVAFERGNAVWRYRVAADGAWRAERGRAAREMADWPENGGPESMARLADGRFVLLAEWAPSPRGGRGRVGLVFPGDPTNERGRPFRFAYLPAPAFAPVDAAALPDGRLLVLERHFTFPNGWASRLVTVAAGAIRPGATVSGREMARLEPPLLADNFEGLAVGREGGRTVIWLVSDDNQSRRQRTLLLKFRLDG